MDQVRDKEKESAMEAASNEGPQSSSAILEQSVVCRWYMPK